MTLFVQLYESNTAAVKSEIGTFFKAFPNGVVWGNTNNGQGYDLVIMGQAEPSRTLRSSAVCWPTARPWCVRSQAVTEKLEDPSQLRKTKKDIARIKTVIRQRDLEQAKQQQQQTAAAAK